jgi:membrane protein
VRIPVLERARAVRGPRLVRALRAAATGYGPDGCPQFAAAIAFHVLLALFPFALLLVTVAGFLLQDDERRADVVAEIVERIPLVSDAGVQLDQALAASSAPLGLLGAVGIVTMLWSASGMMAALRHGLNAAWKVERRHPFVRGKLIDVALVVAVDLLVLVGIGLTLLRPLVSGLVEDASVLDAAFTSWLAGTLFGLIAPLAVTFVALAAIYRLVPASLPRLADVAVGAALAALALRVLEAGFAIYVARFADYDVVYGSLATAVAFLFFVYLAASIVLFGGEVAAAWPATRAMPVLT